MYFIKTMDKSMRHRRMLFPKRSAELVAFIAVSCTLFLFLHTQSLTTKLREMEAKLQPTELSASAIDVNSISRELPMNNVWKNLYNNFNSGKDEVNFEEIQIEIPSPSSINNTMRSELNIVFFNRVPKVGSQTFMELLRRLSIRNGFHFHRDAVQRVETIRLAPEQQEELAEMVTGLSTPSVYVKHVCFTNFTKFNLPKPIYINLVRDPIERVISWYYYVRAPWYYVERKQAFPDLPLPDPRWLRKDFETCVMRGDRECTYGLGETHEGIGDHRRQSLFFCGHDHECTPFNTVEALERAKHAVESQYAVVGVLEDLNTTLAVFEKYIPRFFSGASEIYFDKANNFNQINKNYFKPTVSEHVKNIVRQNFTREIEFYQFCRQRLHQQYLAANLILPTN